MGYRGLMLMLTLATAAVLATGGTAGALECGFFVREDCERVCAGKTVVGCRTCGFWCEECECGRPVDTEVVCCHMKGATCESSQDIPDAFKLMSAEECDRFWGGMGEKTCPKEMCGR